MIDNALYTDIQGPHVMNPYDFCSGAKRLTVVVLS